MGHISPSNTVTPRVRASTSELGRRGRGTVQSIKPSFDLSHKTQQEGQLPSHKPCMGIFRQKEVSSGPSSSSTATARSQGLNSFFAMHLCPESLWGSLVLRPLMGSSLWEALAEVPRGQEKAWGTRAPLLSLSGAVGGGCCQAAAPTKPVYCSTLHRVAQPPATFSCSPPVRRFLPHVPPSGRGHFLRCWISRGPLPPRALIGSQLQGVPFKSLALEEERVGLLLSSFIQGQSF